MIEFSSLNTSEVVPKKGDVIVIQRKVDKIGENILCKVRDVVGGQGGKEIIIGAKNDYFVWDMYISGESWVRRVWNLGQLRLTAMQTQRRHFRAANVKIR